MVSPSAKENHDFWMRLAAAALIGAALFALMPLARMMRAENDFIHWYVGGTLFGTSDLHIEKANQDLQLKFMGAVLDHSYFIRPTFYGLLLKPLTWMPYLTSYVVFQIFSVGCLLFFLKTYARQWPDISVFAIMSVPIISNLVNGQDVTLLLAFCTASLMLARKGATFLPGLCSRSAPSNFTCSSSPQSRCWRKNDTVYSGVPSLARLCYFCWVSQGEAGRYFSVSLPC